MLEYNVDSFSNHFFFKINGLILAYRIKTKMPLL